MKQRIIILSADAWTMVDEKTGEVRKGTSIHYVPALEPICNETDKSYGYKPVKESLEYDFIHQIAEVGGCPCNADVTFVIRQQGGKQLLKIGECVLAKSK